VFVTGDDGLLVETEALIMPLRLSLRPRESFFAMECTALGSVVVRIPARSFDRGPPVGLLACFENNDFCGLGGHGVRCFQVVTGRQESQVFHTE